MKLLIKSIAILGLFAASSNGFSDDLSVKCSDGTFAYKKLDISTSDSNLVFKAQAQSPSKTASRALDFTLSKDLCEVSNEDNKLSISCNDLNDVSVNNEDKAVALTNGKVEFKVVVVKDKFTNEDISGYELSVTNDGNNVFAEKYFYPLNIAGADQTGQCVIK